MATSDAQSSSSSSSSSTQQLAQTISLVENLPEELLQDILLYSREPSLPITTKKLHKKFSFSPVQFKASYLLACWNDAYLYGSSPTDPDAFNFNLTHADLDLDDGDRFNFEEFERVRSKDLSLKNLRVLANIRDPISTLIWDSKLLPAFKDDKRVHQRHFIEIYKQRIEKGNSNGRGNSSSSKTGSSSNPSSPSPSQYSSSPKASSIKSNLQKHRNSSSKYKSGKNQNPVQTVLASSAGMDILAYCSKFRICDHQVVSRIERLIFEKKEFGNIRTVMELESSAGNESASTAQVDGEIKQENQDLTTSEETRSEQRRLKTYELPKRLFKGLNLKSQREKEEEIKKAPPTKEKKRKGKKKDTIPQESHLEEIPSDLAAILSNFGPPPYPSLSVLLSILSILLRSPQNQSLHESVRLPSNAHSGLPLILSTFNKSIFLVSLLLSFGANVSLKNDMALKTAITSSWLDGIKLLVERESQREERWEIGKEELIEWFDRKERNGWNLEEKFENENDSSLKSKKLQDEGRSEGLKFKRIRLGDRITLNSNHLKEAIKVGNLEIINWLLDEKKANPDLETMRKLESLNEGRLS